MWDTLFANNLLSFAASKPGLFLLGICHSCQAAGLSRGIMARSSHRCSAALQEYKAPKLQQPVEAGGASMAPGLPAKTVVALPLQNSPHLVHPCQGPSAGGGAMALWTLHLYLGLMEFLWSWHLPG